MRAHPPSGARAYLGEADVPGLEHERDALLRQALRARRRVQRELPHLRDATVSDRRGSLGGTTFYSPRYQRTQYY